jgi:hypothetical protein
MEVFDLLGDLGVEFGVEVFAKHQQLSDAQQHVLHENIFVV